MHASQKAISFKKKPYSPMTDGISGIFQDSGKPYKEILPGALRVSFQGEDEHSWILICLVKTRESYFRIY